MIRTLTRVGATVGLGALIASGCVLAVGLPAAAADLKPLVFTADGTWVVPEGVAAVSIQAFGAQGGNGLDSRGGDGVPKGVGGLGGSASATIKVTPGDKLAVRVGGAGESRTGFEPVAGGANGGGDSADNFGPGKEFGGGGGGGGSDVRLNGKTLTDRILVAGGGGGAGIRTSGGDGGGEIGGSAEGGGGGGTQTAGGKGGDGQFGDGPYDRADGQPGASGQGGSGGVEYSPGAGGGGGWFGGGGGGGTGVVGTGGGGSDGGGGGSGYAHSDATNVALKAGVRSGGGRVTITPIDATGTRDQADLPVAPTAIPAGATPSPGQSPVPVAVAVLVLLIVTAATSRLYRRSRRSH